MNYLLPPKLIAHERNLVLKEVPELEKKKSIILKWQKNIKSGKIFQLSETQLDVSFINDFFGDILGYEYNEAEVWNVEIKPTTEADNTRPDAALGFFGTKTDRAARAVVELKGAAVNLDKNQNRKDFKGSPVEQAFSYVPKMAGQCRWVIVSNFVEIRLYHVSDSLRFERFEMETLLQEEHLARLFFFLQKDRLFLPSGESRVEQLYAQKRADEEKISTQFYNEYQAIREVLFSNIWKNNPQIAPAEILRVTQKLIDRIVFIAFVRDVIPMQDTLNQALKNDEISFSAKNDKFWSILKDLFRAFDQGLNGRISSFNGGLFKPDALLDETIKIKDFYVKPLVYFALRYDFQSDLNVNILGHIFEQSIADIESMKKDFEIENPLSLLEIDLTDNQRPLAELSKRKKDGVFYTPDHVTQYIVKQTVGAFLDEKKDALLQQYQSENKDYWEAYKVVLTQLKVVDPACGSGAFLTAVFDFLWREWLVVLQETEKIENNGSAAFNEFGGMFAGTKGDVAQEWQIKKSIVQNNIFGVDLNSESVEITRLALWLITANRFTNLADLSDNVKHGNSLISDKSADQYAFNWQQQFGFLFDVVVGNPPYVSANNMDFNQRQYFNNSPEYSCLQGKWDLFVPFVEKALSLLQPNGILSFIIPYGLLNQPFATLLRKHILDNFSLRSIVDLHDVKVFKDATVPTCIPVIHRAPKRFSSVSIAKYHRIDEDNKHVFAHSHYIETDKYYQTENFMFRTERLDDSFVLLQKIKAVGGSVGDFFYVSTGAEIHGKEQRNENGELTSGHSKFELLEANPRAGLKPYIEGSAIPKSRQLGRYCYPEINAYLDYDANVERMRSPKFKELFENPKVIVRGSSGLMGILATIDNRSIYCSHKTTIIISKNHLPDTHSEYQLTNPFSLKCLLAILNSQLTHFYYMSVYSGFIDVYPNYLKALPMPSTLPPETAALLEQYSDTMLEAQKRLSGIRQNFLKLLQSEFSLQKTTEHLEHWHELEWKDFAAEMKKAKSPISTKKGLEWMSVFEEERGKCTNLLLQMEETEKAIDKCVYGLYGLNDKEIQVIENQQDKN